MAEYINRDELELDAEWSEYYDGFTSYSQEQIQSAPTADVIERDEYDKLHQEYLKAIHRHTESLKELHELRSKIDKAIEEMESYEEEVYHRDTEKKEYACIYHCLEILKRNIGI